MTKPGDSLTTNWEEKYEKEHKLRQEAEGELSIIKTTSVTNSPEMRAANEEINTLKNKIADLEEALKSKDINNIDNNKLISINSYDKLIKYRQFY